MSNTLEITNSKGIDRLSFDASGQSQEIHGVYRVGPEASSTIPSQPYSFWVRRCRRYSFLAGRMGPRGDELNEAERTEFVYWLVGEEGNILTSGLTEDGLVTVVRARMETDAEYDARTNYGKF